MRARAIAFYLPQYHPVAANDAFWGKGFTEWTNVTKAKPLFRGHQQPFLPSDLGFYDLRLPEVREQQAQLAREAGIEGFCYWHYWFGNGERVLERVFDEVVASGSPDFPFCLGWANESWTGKWHGLEHETIFKQEYPGAADYIMHFNHLLPAFLDKRYIRVHGKPIFVIYRPDLLPDCRSFCQLWNVLARKHDIPGFYFVSNGYQDSEWCMANSIDGWAYNRLSAVIEQIMASQPMGKRHHLARLRQRVGYRIAGQREYLPHNPPQTLKIANYRDYVDHALQQELELNEYPVIYPNWDSTPRLKERGYVLQAAAAEQFHLLLQSMIDKLQSRPQEERIVFIKSWNEWAEGNTIEPSRLHGRSLLDACAVALQSES